MKELLERKEISREIPLSLAKTKSTTSLAVLFDRETKYLKLAKVPSLSSKMVMGVYQTSLLMWNAISTCTFDNGIENVQHRSLGIATYFCHLHHPWEKGEGRRENGEWRREKGEVEQSNKLIREYITKGIDISSYTEDYVRFVEERLNNMPRKSIGYRTPREYMLELGQLNM